MTDSLDTLVIGGRCAGAPLALSLARGGQDVLVIDAADLPSDQPTSTHFISPYGMKILDDLGLGEAVRDVAPPVPAFTNGVDDAVVRIDLNGSEQGCCPRRADLDALLLEAARAAGARIETGVRLVELLRDNERVIGAVLDHRGQRREVHAKLVVGADGPRSTVAKLTGAEEYHGYAMPRASYWAYWPRPADYATAEAYRGTAAIVHRGSDYYFVFPANRDQLLVGVAFPIETLPEWRGRQRELLFERLRAFSFTAPLVKGDPITTVRGIVKGRFFFRQAAGPGWALVGDAGLFKDPVQGLGISDALSDSQALARAILQGGDVALTRYWRQRDVDSLALFDFTRTSGIPGYNNQLNRVIFGKLAKSAALRARIVKVMTRELSPSHAFSTGEVIRWTLAALCKGQFGVIKPFLAAGENGTRLDKELKRRADLLNAVA